ncbi:hypothetical protein MTYP_02416 [Methylophilaceae bacterium]|nr:hypothetical protein MTYP_02416 [Methylophilaceae bacterium]
MGNLRHCSMVIILLLGTFLASAAMADTQFRMMTLQYRFAQDILPVIEPMVGADGSVRAIDNHLMVTATPERLSQIEALISQLDVARRNLRITVSHAADVQSQQHGIGVQAGGRVGDVEVQLPRGARDGVHIDLDDRSAQYGSANTEFLTVMDGERAFIRVGQSVPYTQQWVALSRRYLRAQQTVEFRDITTGFAVRPRYIGDQVELEITPRIARLDQAGFVDFEELGTVVRVSPGEWFDLGGSMQNRDEISREILSSGQSRESRISKLRIKVD